MVLGLLDMAREFEHTGMIDWLTLKIDLGYLPEAIVRHLQSMNSMIFKVNALTGDVDWQTYAWDSVQSDSHQVCFRVGGEFHVQGSPARIGLPNNAFGSLDIRYCATKMIRFAEQQLGIQALPDLSLWTCSRIDVTRNYVMQSGAEAKQALAYLKQCPEGRQRHSFESFGFYIGKGSSLHKGKIYLKGQDARRNQRSGRAEYTEQQLHKADRLLRAEYTIARHMIRRLREANDLEWYELTHEHLLQLHEEYFREYLSEIEVTDMSNVLERLIAVAPTEGRARAAYDCYTRIRLMGYEQAKMTYPPSTFYKHTHYLREAGFKRADLQAINVTPLRKRAIEVNAPVRHWDDIKAA